MVSVSGIYGALIMCFASLLSYCDSEETRKPLKIEDIISMPSSSSEMFGSKYQREEQQWVEQQKRRAKIDDMKAKGLITPSDEFHDNPVGGKQVEYVSEMKSGVKSSDNVEDIGSDLDLTVERLFASTKKKTKGANKAGNSSDESKFQKFVLDDKYGITIHNDEAVDYAGTEFGSIMEFIDIVTKHKTAYLTRKQLYNSEEFMPKIPEDKRKYYIFKEKILDTDELTKPSEEIIGAKKKGTTLSLLDRVNRITRATRAKKAPYTFKRKTFGTNQASGDVELDGDEDQPTEPYYEDPALNNMDGEEWRKYNEVGNVDKILANYMKMQEIDVNEREARLQKKQSSQEKDETKERVSKIINQIKSEDKIQIEEPKTVKPLKDEAPTNTKYMFVILTKRTKTPTPTTKRKSAKNKRTTKSKTSKLKTTSMKITPKARLLTNATKPTFKNSIKQQSNEKINFISNTTKLFDNITNVEMSRITKSFNDSILPSMKSTSENSIKPSLRSTTVLSTSSSILNFNFVTTKSNPILINYLRGTSYTIKMNEDNHKMNLSTSKSPNFKLSTKSKMIKISLPTFKKVMVKTIGIRKLTTKLKRKVTTLKKT